MAPKQLKGFELHPLSGVITATGFTMTKIAKVTASIENVRSDVDRVVNVRTWAGLANVSYSTAKWLLAHEQGPKVTRLSPHRMGIRLSHHHEWLEARTDRKFGYRADELTRGGE